MKEIEKTKIEMQDDFRLHISDKQDDIDWFVQCLDILEETILETQALALEEMKKDVSGEFNCDLVYRAPLQDGDTYTETYVNYDERKGFNKALQQAADHLRSQKIDKV